MLHRLLWSAALASAALAATTQHPLEYSTLQQPESTPPTQLPYRPLPWGELNVLHTTDTSVGFA